MSMLQPQQRSQILINLGEKLRLDNEPEPSFMTEKVEGFKKDGKYFITSTQLHVLVVNFAL